MLDSPLKYRREQRAHLLRLPRPAVGDGDVDVFAVGDVVAREQQEVEGCEYIILLSTCKCRLTPIPSNFPGRARRRNWSGLRWYE